MTTRPLGCLLLAAVGGAMPPVEPVTVAWDHRARDAALVLASDADRGVFVASGRLVQRLDGADGSLAWSLDHGFPVTHLAVEGDRLLVGGVTLRSVRAADGATAWHQTVEGNGIQSLAADAGGATVGTYPRGTPATRIARFERERGTPVWSLAYSFGADVRALADGGDAVYAGGVDGRVLKIDKARGAILWNARPAARVFDLAAEKETLYAAVADADGTHAVRRLSTSTGAILWTSPSRPGQRLAVGGGALAEAGGNFVRRLDPATGATLWEFDHGGSVFALAVTAGNLLVAGDPAGPGPASVRSLGLADGSVRWSFNHGARTHAVTAAGTGTLLAGDASADGVIARKLVPATANRPPVADAGPDRTVEADAGGFASVVLDGGGSFDPDGDPLTFRWSCPYGALEGSPVLLSLPLGDHPVVLTVDDGRGGTGTDSALIRVTDTAPPRILSVTATPAFLWPSRHRWADVRVEVSVQDAGDPSPSTRIVSISSNEPADGRGDGATAADWEITGALAARLRPERSGRGTGRVYTIEVESVDRSGNAARGSVAVRVAHDQRR